MNVIPPVIFTLVSMLILVLNFASKNFFAFFYHFALSKFSSKRADDAALSFILGTEFFIVITWFIIFFVTFAIFINLPDLTTSAFPWILVGIIIVEFLALFLPRKLSNNFIRRAAGAKTRSDFIMLGFLAGLADLPFMIFPLFGCAYFLQSFPILENAAFSNALTSVLVILAVVLPLFLIRIYYRTGHNLADFLKRQSKLSPRLTIKSTPEKELKDPYPAIKRTLRRHAKGLQIPTGAADDFINNAIEKTKQSLSRKKVITNDDLTRELTKNLKKFDRNLAYVYEKCAIIL